MCAFNSQATRSNDGILLRLRFGFQIENDEISALIQLFIYFVDCIVCLFGLIRLIFQAIHSQEKQKQTKMQTTRRIFAEWSFQNTNIGIYHLDCVIGSTPKSMGWISFRKRIYSTSSKLFELQWICAHCIRFDLIMKFFRMPKQKQRERTLLDFFNSFET